MKIVSAAVWNRAWPVLRPYVLAVGLLGCGDALMAGVDRYLVAYAFPWATVSLLIITAIAGFWGWRPAALALVLAALFGDLIVPYQHISLISPDFSWRVRVIRTLLFAVCSTILIVVTRQAQVMRERAAQRRQVVQALQRMVLPDKVSAIPGCDIATLYRPARAEEEVGGDFYDVFPVDAGGSVFGILFGDVQGKGKEAAEHTAVLRYTVRACLGLGLSPAACLRSVNGVLEAQQSSLGSASLFVGLLCADTGVLRYANAGHEPPLFLRSGDRCDLLASTGTLVGVFADAPYEEAAIELAPGDALLLVTDGVTEARDPDGNFLDETGARDLLRPALRAPRSADVVADFARRLDRFTGGVQRDDIAVLFLRCQKPARTLTPATISPVPSGHTQYRSSVTAPGPGAGLEASKIALPPSSLPSGPML